MQFAERKLENKYQYTTDGEYGDISIEVPYQLNGLMLDDIFMAILNMKRREKHVSGSIELPKNPTDNGQKNWQGGEAEFVFEKSNVKAWDDVLKKKDIKFIEKHTGKKLVDLKSGEIHIISDKFARCGYRRNKEFKEFLIDNFNSNNK